MTGTATKIDPAEIYRAHVQQVGRWVLRLGGPAIDVEDTVHEVFAIACARLAGFRGESSMATWLFGIADKVVRQRRRKDRWRLWFGVQAKETAGCLAGAAPPDPLGAFEQGQSARNVYRVLDRLPEEDRRVLILCELEELGAEEVGKLLGIKPGHARVRLHRARAKFMRAYQQEFKAATDPPGERCRHVGR